MSWDDWTAGLSGTALQKVRELQVQHDRLQREKQQRQLQLDSTEATLSKQKQKFEEVRVELTGVRKELQVSQEEVQVAVRERQRLSQELQVKQAQVCGLEGQLDSARKQSHSLSQDVKRLEAELEKLQNASSSGDSVLFSTPCWNVSSREPSGSRREQRDSSGSDGDFKGQHIRQLQYAEHSPSSASSPFPWPSPSTPPSGRRHRPPKTSSASGVFPWEREPVSPAPRGRPASVAQPSGDVIERLGPEDGEKETDLRRENDLQRSKIAELKTWVQSLEKEVRSASDRHRESEARLAEARGEMAVREQNLSRAKEELERTNRCMEKERDRAQAAEQRVKQLQEELSCQRQNAESSRRSAEQRRKDMEREHQRELLELQKEGQSRERQHQQECGRLNQELQQARALHNSLQAQCDKVLLQKQAVEKDLDGVKGKLQWTEKELKESQKKEAQIQSKLTEALREKDSLGLSLEQSSQRVKGLEEEVKRLGQELADAVRLQSELQAQLAVPAMPAVPARCFPVGDSFSSSVTPHRPAHVPKKKVVRPDKPRDELQEQRAKYPSDREPGEGIDSDFIEQFGSSVPENLKDASGRARSEADRGLSTDQTHVHEVGPSLKEPQDTGSDQSSTVQSDVAVLTKKQGQSGSDGDSQAEDVGVQSHDSVSSCGAKDQLSSPSELDVRRENAALREDLREAKRELEQRLEDLETQRRAETEARTKLKQLSRKNSSQVEKLRQKTQELKDEGGKLEKQLEEEKKEGSRLRTALDALETERRKEQEEKEREEEEEKAEIDQLRTDLAALESELREEQDARETEREEGERERLKNEESRRALAEKLEEVEAELERLRNSKNEEENGNEEADNRLTPVILDLNSNNNNAAATLDENLIPSPNEGTPISAKVLEKDEIDWISEEGAKSLKLPGFGVGPCPDTAAVDGLEKTGALLDSDEVVQMVLEVERLRGACTKLRGERDRESAKAKQAHDRLEVLQNQVTNQTKQLTLAFENQSTNIKGLLGELQERESSLQGLEEELRGCRGEMAELKAENLKLVSKGSQRPEETGPLKATCSIPATVGEPVPEGIDTKQTSKIMTLQRELLGRDSTLQRLEKELRGCRREIAALKAENLKLGSTGAEEPEETRPVKAACQISATVDEPVAVVINTKQTAKITTLQDPERTPPQQVLQFVNSDGSVRDLQAELRDLKAKNEELRSELAAAANVKGLNCVGLDQSALTEDGATQRLVAELEAAREDIRLMTLKNEELQSMLYPAKSLNKQEKQCLDSEVKLYPLFASQQTVMVSGDLSTRDKEAKGKMETLGNQGFLPEQGENDDMKLMVETASFLEGSMQPSMVTGHEAGDVLHHCNKDSNEDVQRHLDAITRLQAENRALRSWALETCPPDRQRELDAIFGRGVHGGTCHELADGDNRVTLGVNLADEESSGLRSDVSEQSSQSDASLQLLLKLPPAQETTCPHSSDELNVNSGIDKRKPIQSKLHDWKSGRIEDADLRPKFPDATGVELESFSPSELAALQKQLAELKSQISSLREENMRQAEELEIWRVAGESISPLLIEDATIRPQQGSVVVVHEDQLLLTCTADGLLASTHMGRDVRVELCVEEDILNEKNSAAVEMGNSREGQGSLKMPMRTMESLGSTKSLSETIQVPNADSEIQRDFKTKGRARVDLDTQSNARTNSHDVGHQRSVIVDGDAHAKVIEYSVACKHTKATEDTLRDNAEKGADSDSVLKTDGCRITEDHIKADHHGDSRTKEEYKTRTDDHKGTRAVVFDSAGAVNERNEPVKNTLRAETQQTTKTCTTDSVKTDDGGSLCLEEKGKELTVTKSISPAENTQLFRAQTGTLSEKRGLSNNSHLCTAVDTTDKSTLIAPHWLLRDSIAEVPKLVCPGTESGNEPLQSESSAPCWPEVATGDFKISTEVERKSQRAGGDGEGGVLTERRSTATQTDGGSGATGGASSEPFADGKVMQDSSTQTGASEMLDQDSDASNEDTELNPDSPPLSPSLVSEGAASVLFSGSFPIPADPARLAERIRRNRSRMSAAFDDTEYEPYGLPEVVMKGFADIPSGPACPYVLRRGLLGTDALPLPLREQDEEEEEELDP